jgi:predicted N-acetyltransferase YhbS
VVAKHSANKTKTFVSVRQLRESDVPQADQICRSAFNTFTGAPDLFGDRDYVIHRQRALPEAALAAEVGGELVGPNFATGWGSVGFFGPLSVRPDLWDRGIAKALMESTMDIFAAWGPNTQACSHFRRVRSTSASTRSLASGPAF